MIRSRLTLAAQMLSDDVQVRIERQPYRGYLAVEIRLYVRKLGTPGEWEPARDRIRFNITQLSDFMDAVMDAQAKLIKGGQR
jgi:hypothetical protein